MCIPSVHTGIESLTLEKKYRLGDFFDQHWDTYIQSPSAYIEPEQYKAVAAMRVCRTEALGVDHYACPGCGEMSQVYHSCKNRFCPTCSWKDTMKWAEKMKDSMMNIPHRHVVFTLPHQLNNLIKENKRQLLDFLFKAASDSIKDWMWKKYRLKPGIISVLHTFGETKSFHCHIHMIVSWGGLNSSNWIEEIKGEYVNYEFIQKKFRCKFEDRLVELYDSGALEHGFKRRVDFMSFLRRVNQKNWRVHFEPAMAIPEEVIRYIGRYSKRACLSEYKITSIEGEYISFRWKDYKNLDINGKPIEKELRLHYRDFFPLLLQHVPLPYFRIVRYYGVYAARTKAILERCYKDPVVEDKVEEVEETYREEENPKYCPHCKIEKVYQYTTFSNKDGQIIYMSRHNLVKDMEKAIAA
jgi:hypothetical protein